MARPMPHRRGARCAVALPIFVTLACVRPAIAQQPAPSIPPAPAATPSPAPYFPAPPIVQVVPPTVSDLPLASGKDNTLAASPGSAHNLITRIAPSPMGKNNAVRLWVHGDGNVAVMRVRLSVQSETDNPDASPLRPNWVCAPISLSFTGWKQIILPRSKFNLHSAPAPALAVNMALPADAQPPASNSSAPADWKKINAITLETRVPRRATLIVDDVSWVTLEASGAVADETSVDDFEKGNVAAWVPGGPSAEQNSLVYGLATQPGQAHGGRIAFRLTVTSPAAMRQTTLAAFNKSLLVTGKTYAVFTPVSLFDPILPSTLPVKGGTSSQVSVRACPEQIQAASFCLYSSKALSNVTVTVPGDLQAVGHVFARANINIHIVKVWEQGGAGVLQDTDTAALVPELLVKDDRIALTGNAPQVRLTGAPVTDLPADSTKQFWVTVTVPRGTPAARYTGSLRVVAAGQPAINVPIDVTVLPLRLMSPAKQYAINLRSRLDTPPPANLPTADGQNLVTDFVTKDALDKQLTDIYAHGIRIPTVYDSPQTLAQAIAEYRQYGMGEPYVYRGAGDLLAIDAARKTTPVGPFVFNDSDYPLTANGPGMAAITAAKLIPAALLTSQMDYDTMNAALGLAIYNRDSAYAQKLIQTKGLRLSSTRDWWYWPASIENPLVNRLDAGFLLWRANLYGAYLPEYMTAFGTDPYDETSAGAADAFSAYRPQMLAYPSADGPIDTLQWEAVREGITDARYLTTMYASLREAKDAHISKALISDAETYVKAFLDKPLAGLPESELDKARTQIASYALQLRTAVDAYNKKNNIKP